MSIDKLNFNERSLLFAKLSSIAYNNIKKATSQAKNLGFTTVGFYDKDGAQAYRFMNKSDIVIACRGTQPNEFNDIKADLKALPVMAETVSRVHRGFKADERTMAPPPPPPLPGYKIFSVKQILIEAEVLGHSLETRSLYYGFTL